MYNLIKIVLNIFFLILLLSIAFAGMSLAPFVPAKRRDLDRINRLCKLKPGDNFVEIGCGMSRVCTFIAKNNEDVNVVGVELALPLYLYSKIKTALFGPKNLHIKLGNAFKYDFSNANVVYVYGFPKTISGKLMTKLEQELPKGAKYVSYVFSVKGWKGEVSFDKEKETDNKIYVCVK